VADVLSTGLLQQAVSDPDLTDLQLEHLLCALGLLRGHLHPGGTALPQLLQLQLEALLLLLVNLRPKGTSTLRIYRIKKTTKGSPTALDFYRPDRWQPRFRPGFLGAAAAPAPSPSACPPGPSPLPRIPPPGPGSARWTRCRTEADLGRLRSRSPCSCWRTSARCPSWCGRVRRRAGRSSWAPGGRQRPLPTPGCSRRCRKAGGW